MLSETTTDRLTIVLAFLNAITILLGYAASMMLDTWQAASPVANIVFV